MISKILIKLIDQAIVPAILLLCTRFISVVIFSKLFQIKFILGAGGFTFPSKEEYLRINSYSTLAMIAVLAVGVIYILIKAFVFHDTHIAPHITTHLFQLRLTTFIQNSFELYSQGFAWLAYLYLFTILSGVLVLYSLIYNWVFFSSVVLCLVSTVLLIFDVENEIEIKKSENKFIEDSTPAGIYLDKSKQ